MSTSIKPLTCAWCGHYSVNQYGGSPFDHMAQVERFPSIFLHLRCGDRVARFLAEETGQDMTHPFIAQFRGNYNLE